MFTEHIGNLHSATSLDQLKQVLEQILGDCESALTHNGTLDINGALKAGSTGAVVNISNGYIAPNDATTAPDDNGELPNGWAQIIDGAAWFKGQVKFDQAPVGDGGGIAALPVGSVILWAGAIGSIPSGWALMDGTANTTGSGIDMRGQIPYGYSGAGDFATIGGTIAIALATSFSGSSTATTSTNGAHGHNVSGTEIAGAISISAHAASSGSANISTAVDLWSVDDSPGSGLEAFDGTNADATFLSGDGFDIQDSGHDHNIAKSDIASALANHTISDTAVTAETDSQGDHTHTVSISAIAGSLSINTPSTVRTPGKVLAFIEKIS